MPHPVLIVGAGPTGLTAAYELARQGVPVRLIEKSASPATTSRAIAVQARTLEMLAQRGLADTLVARGVQTRIAQFYGEGAPLFRLDFAHLESRFPYILFVSQVETEAVLRGACAALGVETEWDTELVAIARESHDGQARPTAVLRGPGGTLEELHPDWMIASGGAHSLIRRTLNLPFEGKSVGQGFVLGDQRVSGALAPEELHIFSSSDGFLGMFPLGGGRFRLIASDVAGSEQPDLATLQQVFDARAHLPATLHDLTWSSRFAINSRMVGTLRVGRFLLGGDAAHIHSPAGGQGMNTGMQDMMNLGWKLARVIEGTAPESLLDSYEAERLPVIRDLLHGTEALTANMASTSPVRRMLIDHISPYLGSRDLVQEKVAARMGQIAIGYEGGPLSNGPHARGTIAPGTRLPDPPLEVARDGAWHPAHAQDLVDPSGFVLLCTGDGPAPQSPFAKSLKLRPAPDHAEAFAQIFGHDGAAVLVRPDGYVALSAPLVDTARAVEAYAEVHFAT
ncbi:MULTISPECIES: FAD-dependent oxidoreductase [Thioclava]|uniref:FAD-dependent oxidoreductase n=1 Tax=Thioclava TaxID=285107 RepID=UPI000C5C95D3|nr:MULTISPECIES: FAD-dependent oxidoreductase [Thioclava]MAQ36448.1 2-polyprenyl-6-methoxyphenol hydroxylase [Thioclava sp.]